MSVSTTRISDLPDNGISHIPSQQGMSQGMAQGMISASPSPVTPSGMGNGMYVPINPHPNPYGNASQPNPDSVPYPKQDLSTSNGERTSSNNWEGIENTGEGQHYRLPARDIPNDTAEYIHDDGIRANYVPRKKLTSDYIREFEEKEDILAKKHESKKRQRDNSEELFSKIQTTLVASLLFIAFHLSLVDSVIYKYLNFLAIYDGAGNLNFYGVVVKSLLFGMVFYSICELSRIAGSWGLD
jgi:hypothetical protein